MSIRLLSILAVTGLLIASSFSANALSPDGLMVDLFAMPERVLLVHDKPGFSWSFAPSKNGDRQTAYQIQVAGDPKSFEAAPDYWDSGRVDSNRSLHVPYAGKTLTGGERLYWRVRAWDADGKEGPWSAVQMFRMAEKVGPDQVLRYASETSIVEPSRLVRVSETNTFVDFGKDAFGWLVFIVPENAPTGEIVVHLGEMSDGLSVHRKPGGSIRYERIVGEITEPGVYRLPMSFPKPPRGPFGWIHPLPDDMGVVMPFRYVEIEKSPFPITPDNIRQQFVHYPFDDTAGEFQCSDNRLNAIYELCKYSMKATSFLGIYIDGDRERLPYEADAYINQLSHYAVDREFTLARYSHEQLAFHQPTWPTEWKQHSVMMAWQDWMYTGNTDSLARCYDLLREKKTLEFCTRESDGLLVTGGPAAPMESGIRDIVDWPAGERDGYDFKPVNTVVNAFYCLNLKQMADIADALGKKEDAAMYREKTARTIRAFNALLFDAKTGLYVDGEGSTHSSLHANMMPLAFDLVPPEHRKKVVDFVVSRGMACSVYGAQYLLEALFLANREDAAFERMTTDDIRGWMSMIEQGTTITLEAWAMKFKPNLDWNHAWGAAPGNVIPRYVLGIRPETPGFGVIRIEPQPFELAFADGVVPTIRGPVHVRLDRDEKAKTLRITSRIPASTTGKIVLPAGNGAVTLNGQPAETKTEGDKRYVEIVSGTNILTVEQSR